jgi:DNA-binding response OmpR family regulator
LSPNVLIVDDAPDQLHILNAMVRSEVPLAQTSMCTTVDEAVKIIDTKIPDLLILDLVLKEESGEEILKYIRKLSNTVPVLVVTGTKSEEALGRLFELQANDYILKPLDALIFESKLRSLLTGKYISPLQFLGRREPLGKIEVDTDMKIVRLDEFSAVIRANLQFLPGAEFNLALDKVIVPCKVTQVQPVGPEAFELNCEIKIKSISNRAAFRKFLMEKTLTVKREAA